MKICIGSSSGQRGGQQGSREFPGEGWRPGRWSWKRAPRERDHSDTLRAKQNLQRSGREPEQAGSAACGGGGQEGAGPRPRQRGGLAGPPVAPCGCQGCAGTRDRESLEPCLALNHGSHSHVRRAMAGAAWRAGKLDGDSGTWPCHHPEEPGRLLSAC